MKMLARAGLALSALFACSSASVAAPKVALCSTADGTVKYCAGVQEGLPLATANVAAPAQTVYGGTYIFAQMATAYGTVALQVMGPDGVTYETVISKSATDTTGGTAIQLQGGATVKAVLTGTTAANVTLTRVP